MSLLIPNRRSFLTGLGSLLAAPLVVKAENLMPVRNIDHILYPIRGLITYGIGSDELLVRLDRANFPINMRLIYADYFYLTEKEINTLFTKEQLNLLIPTKPKQQMCLTVPYDQEQWKEKGLPTIKWPSVENN